MLYPYNHDEKRILTATSSAHFLTNDGSASIARSPGLSGSLQRLGTSDMSLNKVQVATSSDFCWENTCLCGHCLVSVCDTTVLPFVIDCKLASE